MRIRRRIWFGVPIAIAAMLLLGMAMVEGGRLVGTQRALQVEVDGAALRAALPVSEGRDPNEALQGLDLDLPPMHWLAHPPPQGAYRGKAEAVQVHAEIPYSPLFPPLFGRELRLKATATAEFIVVDPATGLGAARRVE